MLDILIDNGLTIIAALAAMFIVPKIGGAIGAFTEKLNISSALINRQRLEAFILQQILRVKEEVAAAVKKNEAVMSAEDKLESVVEAALDAFPGINAQEAEDLTKALLASVGEGATALSEAALQDMIRQQFGVPQPPPLARLQ